MIKTSDMSMSKRDKAAFNDVYNVLRNRYDEKVSRGNITIDSVSAILVDNQVAVTVVGTAVDDPIQFTWRSDHVETAGASLVMLISYLNQVFKVHDVPF